MQANEYQELTARTEIYSEAAEMFAMSLSVPELYAAAEPQLLWLKLAYCTGKLNGEAGELAELIFKSFREGRGEVSDVRRALAFKELGNILWYVARISDLFEFKLEDVMQANIDKLLDRQKRDMLTGDGDER